MTTEPSNEDLNKAFERCRPLIRQAVRRSRDRLPGLTSEDLEQEVSIKMLQVLRSGRKVAHLASYINRVVATVVIDLSRKAKVRNLETPFADGEVDIADEERAADSAALRKIMTAIESLPENQRIAVSLRLQGCTAREISQLTDWSTGKAESTLKRGMRILRQKLENMGLRHEVE